jgi:hypothetical protein
LKIRCPQCHKFFEVEREGKEVIDDEKSEGLHSTWKDKEQDVKDFVKHPLNMHPMPNEDSVEVEDIDTETDYK